MGPPPAVPFGEIDHRGEPAKPAFRRGLRLQHTEFVNYQGTEELLLPCHRGFELHADDVAAPRLVNGAVQFFQGKLPSLGQQPLTDLLDREAVRRDGVKAVRGCCSRAVRDPNVPDA